jgi:sugar phosphate isomerase/epimerase
MTRSHNAPNQLSIRRELLSGTSTFEAAGTVAEQTAADSESPFKISLAQWSLRRQFLGRPVEDAGGGVTTLDFPKLARREFDIDAVEYVNTFFLDKATNQKYLSELRRVADGEGVRNFLIMCDSEGSLGHPDAVMRSRAVENHSKWLGAAAALGCHAIRVNALSEGTPNEQLKLVADGYSRLCDSAEKFDVSVLIENHGGLSSNGAWIASLMQEVDHPRAGTLPDFGNFGVTETERYDPYKGVSEMMPFAKAVSAKSYNFDSAGNETTLDFHRLMDIVLSAGYTGYVGVEYEGSVMSEFDGVRATKQLLERIRAERS